VKASALEMETASFSETLACTNQSALQLNPKEHNQNCHRREVLKSHDFCDLEQGFMIGTYGDKIMLIYHIIYAAERTSVIYYYTVISRNYRLLLKNPFLLL
jgi:hypothetical protein